MLKKLTVLLLIIVFAVAAGCQGTEPAGEAISYREITAEEVLAWMEEGREFRLIDVREEHEYSEAHIPGAELLPLGQLEESYVMLDPEDVIVLVCRSARRSGEATRFLYEKGYTEVYNLVGGMLEWPGSVNQPRAVYG